MNNAAAEFLRRHGMHPDCIPMAESCGRFLLEMKQGLKGEPSSLMMIPAYVSPEHQLPKDASVAVLDAGGTNLRSGRCHVSDGNITLEQVQVCPMPGTVSPLSTEEFLETLADQLEPVLKDCAGLGFCFSFPAEITPDLDGILLGFNKEVVVRDSAGMHICQALNETLARRGIPAQKYALINDTVATLLGGYGATEPEAWDGYIGFILGTGTNCCYTEQVEKIEKLPNSVGHTMVVNIEAGGYGQFPTGDFDRAVDARSNNPGEHLYEKMVSGGYFGEIALEMLRSAIVEGLLTGQAPEVLEMKAICAFLEDPGSPTPLMAFCGDPTEKEILYTLLDLLLERAAKMIAVNLTAILVQGDMGRSPEKPACIVVEGSTFQKASAYQEKIRFHMRALATDKYGKYFRFRSFPDNNLRGAAVAALLK